MTQHSFRVTIVRKDGTVEDGGLVNFEGQDYDNFRDEQALNEIMAHQTDYGLVVDPGANLVRWKGVMMPFTDFSKFQVTLVSKAV